MSDFVAGLRRAGWQVEAAAHDTAIPAHILARYGDLPSGLVAFISSFSRCFDATERAWFVAASDLVERDDPFRFNEFELMSLSAAESDEAWSAGIRAFWTEHFPIFLSVSGTYQYFALSLSGPAEGSVVYGAAPEFEECSVVAPSLTAFLDMFLVAVRSPEPPFPFGAAIPRHAD